MNLKQHTEHIKTACARIIGKPQCFFCRCYTSKKGMVIHHRWYIENDVIRKNYPSNGSGTLDYYLDLLPLIEKNPKRFRYCCNTCHQAYERIKRYSQKRLSKFTTEIKASQRDKVKYDND